MKKITFLLLLLISSLTLLAQSNTKNTVEISTTQVTELYKIVKQNGFLKDLSRKQEAELKLAKSIIDEQKQTIYKYSELSKSKDVLLENFKFQSEKLLESKDVEIQKLKDLEEINKKIYKRENAKKFWKGFTYGGITIGVVGVVFLIAK